MQDKLPADVQPEKVATAPSKEPIAEEEGDATSVESAEEPVQEETENAEPEPEKEEVPAVETKEVVPTEEKSEKQSGFAACGTCCEGDVLKNLQAAVGLAV